MNVETTYRRIMGRGRRSMYREGLKMDKTFRVMAHGRTMWKTSLKYLIAFAVLAAAPAPAVHAQGTGVFQGAFSIDMGLVDTGGLADTGVQFAFGGLSQDCFSYPAVAMTPYDLNIQQNQYRMTHEQVYHNIGQTGAILLYGPVHPWKAFGDGLTFSVTYKDPDGHATAGRVRAQLRHVGPSGIRIIATLDSNDHAQASNDAQIMSAGLQWSQVSANTGYFVVRVYVERTDTVVAPAAFGYNLCSAIF
jgi:hypothetical protein